MSAENAIESIRQTIELWRNESETADIKGDKNIAEYISIFHKNIGKCIIQVHPLIVNGFSCGLGRMLDTSQKDQAELMPYLLTAYMVNFPKNKFVKNYLSKCQEAVSESKNVSLEKIRVDKRKESKEKDSPIMGIEHLLSHEEPSNPKAFTKEFDRLANRFRFHSESMEIISPYFLPPKYFIIPKHGAATFTRKLASQHFFEQLDTDERKIVKVYTGFKNKDDVSQIYDCELITNIFVVWYASICEYLEDSNSIVPDAYKCVDCMLKGIGNYSPFLYDVSQYWKSNGKPSSQRMKIHQKIMLYYKGLCSSAANWE